jgi:hypothetical protein
LHEVGHDGAHQRQRGIGLLDREYSSLYGPLLEDLAGSHEIIFPLKVTKNLVEKSY